MAFQDELAAYAMRINDRLATLLPEDHQEPRELCQAIRYACLASGKRLRPAMTLAACAAVGGNSDDALDAACAVEMIHCFSLIHDDLPAIDNDVLRRGLPTCHVQFGEAMAILAGDALFALAFEVIGSSSSSLECRLESIRYLTRASGLSGLVGGEASDVLAEGLSVDRATLEQIHRRKTGALISAACSIGGLCGAAHPDEITALSRYGEAIGLAYQIVDDILDATSTTETLGKTARSDSARKKQTYPAIIGLEGSRNLASDLIKSAQQSLSVLSGDSSFFEHLAEFCISRDK